MFLFEKAQAARDEQLFWSTQLNSDRLNIVMLLRECHAWFHVGYVNITPIDRKLKTQPCLCNKSLKSARYMQKRSDLRHTQKQREDPEIHGQHWDERGIKNT